MSHDRRRFLGHAAVAAAALLTLGRSGVSLAASSVGTPAFGLATLQRMVGHAFRLEGEHGTAVSLQLVQVVPLRTTSGYADAERAREQCFTLVFRGTREVPLDEGIYAFSSEGLASFSAFISPIRGDGVSYQAVFGNA